MKCQLGRAFCRTLENREIPVAQNNAAWHHKSDLFEDVRQATRAALKE
jgi:hypothetical protein